MPLIMPYINMAVGWLFLFIEIFGGMFVVAYAAVLAFVFNVRVIVHEYTKGGKTTIRMRRAREVKSKAGIPKLEFIHPTVFWGERINSPPNECAFPYKSRFIKKCYELIHKDGLYYPIPNIVVGVGYQISGELKDEKIESIMEYCKANNLTLLSTKKKDENVIYSMEGSGLAVSRDYDFETAIANKINSDAMRFRNKKPVELVAMYGIVVVALLVSGVIMVYSLKKVGDLFTTLGQLSTPIHDAVKSAIVQKIGPG